MLLLTGDVEEAIPLTVTREGFVVIPQVGQLYVASLTLGQLEDLLYARLGRVYSGVRRGADARTRFSVSVVQLRSNQIFVVGDVERPGSYRISSAGTALTALYAAGGPTEAGSLRRIEVRRGGRVVDVLDVYDYLVRGDASHDVRLQSGDVVFVPPPARPCARAGRGAPSGHVRGRARRDAP
jgi:protein involved in polysaccharide export with SLBB domain